MTRLILVALPDRAHPAREEPVMSRVAAHAVTCPGCQKSIDVRATAAGTRIRCRGCGEVFAVPAAAVAEERHALAVHRAVTTLELPPATRAASVFVGSTASALGFQCPFCRSHAPPRRRWKVAALGQLISLLLIVSCYGIVVCWVPLFWGDWQHRCRDCGVKLG